ncbi:hypothetical protein EGW08_020610, partial [Elysia chlorotica]
TVIGVHLMVASVSMSWIVGNLLAYMNSFFRFQCSPYCFDGDPQWIVNLYNALFGVGLFVFEYIRNTVGLWWTTLLAILVHTSSFFLCVWAVQVSVVAVCVLMGVFMAAAAGVIMNAGFAYIHIRAPQNAEVYMITVIASGPLLNVVQNQIITSFVNPLNLKPDVYQSPWASFSQSEILQRVPTVIAIVASIDLGFQLIGFLLDHATTKPEDGSLQTTASKDVYLEVSNQGRTNQRDCETEQIQFTLQEATRTAKFWSLWLYGASTGLCTVLLTSYYKQFGLVYIDNDRHLTLLGSAMPLLVGLSGMLLGALKKKDLVNIHDSLVLSLSLNSLTSAFWFFAAMLGEAVYMVLILLMTFSHSFIFFVMANGTMQEFGNAHFATIYSVAFSGRPIVSLFSAAYLTPLLDAVGWFWVFMSSSVLSSVALVFTVL